MGRILALPRHEQPWISAGASVFRFWSWQRCSVPRLRASLRVNTGGREVVGELMGGEVWQESRRCERSERLACALARPSRELGDGRSEIIMLNREVAALRGRPAHLALGGYAGDAPGDGRDGLRNRFVAVGGRDG